MPFNQKRKKNGRFYNFLRIVFVKCKLLSCYYKILIGVSTWIILYYLTIS